MDLDITTVVFCLFCGLTLLSSLMVVLQNHPVRAVLFLVLTFFSSTVLWLILKAEFLGLILILVYVGAVMTLFLFVVMMLHVDIEAIRTHLLRLLPLGGVIVIALGSCLVYALSHSVLPKQFKETSTIFATVVKPDPTGPKKIQSNTEAIGQVLYTDYIYPFELAAVILLVAMIAAITLVHRESRSKKQEVRAQIMTDPRDRLTLVSMKPEGESK